MPTRPPLPAVKDANILFLDFETGGLSPRTTDVIEVGCVLTDPTGRTVLEEFEARVVPTRPVEPDAARINGYNAEKWAAEGVPLLTAMTRVLQLATGAVMCCHNAPFDKAFLDASLVTTRQRWTGRYHTYCTVALATPLLRRGMVENTKLDTLARFFGVDQGEPHRAISDARACRGVFLKLADICDPAIEAYAARKTAAAAALSKDANQVTQVLPDGTVVGDPPLTKGVDLGTGY